MCIKIAIIDIGTNTCNLLISEYDKNSFNLLYQDKKMIRLGDSTIASDIISQPAINRTLNVLSRFFSVIKKYEVDKIKMLATSAVRTAKNQVEFLDSITKHTKTVAKVIKKHKEADLIFKGVLLALNELPEPSLILDIGGGSNEFIIAEGDVDIWMESKPAGMARILHQFQLSDPITKPEILKLEKYFANVYKKTFEMAGENHVTTLIGCSGAFDTIADIIDGVSTRERQRVKKEIAIEQFKQVHQLIINSNLNQRLNMKGIDDVRVDLIVPAMVLINLVVDKLSIQKIIQTDFALREGVLYKKMHQLSYKTT